LPASDFWPVEDLGGLTASSAGVDILDAFSFSWLESSAGFAGYFGNFGKFLQGLRKKLKIFVNAGN
jgi:hypothetical protein